MPAATLNRDRTAGQQHPGARSQLYQDQTEDARQLHDLAQQYNQDLLNGTPHSTPSIETLVMSMALEQDVDLSSFSMASQGDPQSSLAPNASCDPPSSQAGQQGYADINQTQLLSGSRS
ncbi:hypothetical protein BGZ54_009413 [Gamsiella multidivaricata]|nr:hypothetical protein BGZ54_009413 [Gamsiella multidivaricata]